jgi:hypothetical protein
MENEMFWKLHSNIALHLIHNNRQHDIMYRDWATNGRILASTHISCALQYFAGSCPYDIAIMHGVSHTAVFDSVWMVVDGINTCPELDIKFPTSHEEQRKLDDTYGWRYTIANIPVVKVGMNAY